MIKYEGGYATDHRLPAYEAGAAIYGFARSVSMISHYLVEGKVKKRIPFSDEFVLLYEAPARGSFLEIFQIISENPLLSMLAGTGISEAIRYLYGKSTGGTEFEKPESLDQIGRSDDGALDSLVDGIQPSIKQLHQPIGNGVNNIFIVSGDGNSIEFNQSTKEFVNTTNISPIIQVKAVSVASFNVNTRYGRVFDRELGVTIPFEIPIDVDARTVPNIASSLNRYAVQDKSLVMIRYRSLTAPNGDVKKFYIYDAWFEED